MVGVIVGLGAPTLLSAQETGGDEVGAEKADSKKEEAEKGRADAEKQDSERKERSRPTQFGGKKPHEMNEAELEEAGYLWEPESEHGPSLVGGLVAAVPGSVVHGMGHYFVRNSQAGQDLLLLELGALAALGGSGLLYGLVDNRDSFWGETGLLALQIGGALYSISYVADVVGVSKGTESQLSRVSQRVDGVLVEGGYTFLLVNDLPCDASSPCQAVDVGLMAHLGNVTLRPYARLSMYPFNTYDELGVELNWHVVPGQSPQEYFGFGFSLSQVSFTGLKGTQPDASLITDGVGGESQNDSRAVSRLEIALADLSLDLEVLLQHLDNVLVQSSAGLGIGFNSGERAAVPGSRRAPYVFLEHAFLFNLTPELMMRPYYIFSEAEAVGRSSEWIGAFGFEAVWTPMADWDIYVDGRGGNGAMVSSGVRYNIWE
ncbi:MAG: hypothetical protein CMH57_14485 [Myxococcales bacterium]|nr:hypothetical protein [Myxococcales bacterium]